MEQITFAGPRTLERRDVPAPALQGDGEAIVRPLAVATCDLDALILAGASPFQPPFAFGHECVAEVVDVGDGVTNVAPGDRVSVPFQISCGECASCLRGRTGNCRGVPWQSTYGFGPHVERWGGFLSERIRVPFADHMLVKLPAGLEPASVASASDNIVDAWRTVGPLLEREPGAAVLVVGGAGPGSIGLYAAGLALAAGSERVVYADRDERRRAIAAGFGAELAAADAFPDRLGSFPITVDASANPEGLLLAIRSTAADGVCTSIGIYFDGGPKLPLLEMYVRNTTFVTGRCHARPDIPRVLELTADDRFDPARVTTDVVGWDDAVDALVEGRWTKLVVRGPLRAS
jgi:threonine dehydrogenase-like Zn-dependent dehydrogenase